MYLCVYIFVNGNIPISLTICCCASALPHCHNVIEMKMNKLRIYILFGQLIQFSVYLFNQQMRRTNQVEMPKTKSQVGSDRRVCVCVRYI